MPSKPKLKICELCGQEYWDKSGKNRQRFCSIQCGAKARYKPAKVPKRQQPRETRKCLVCQSAFEFRVTPTTREGSGKYCSRNCKGIASRCAPAICKVCGKEFTRTLTSKQCCSVECRHMAKRTGREVSCDYCGVLVYKENVHLSHANHFCCMKHANAYQCRNKTEHVCKMCGKGFRKSASHSSQNNIQYCSIKCRNADPVQRERLIQMNKAQQEGKPTSIEVIGYALLNRLKVDYLPQHLIGGKFCVDAFVPSANLVIQFDGDYWHFNPAKFSEPDARQKKRMQLDKSQDKYMNACGYTVIRLWETDLQKNIETVKAKVQAALIPV